MSEVKFSSQAYCKLILHAAKYPYAAVNGVLLAHEKKKGGSVYLVDAVPLFHTPLNLAPMAEIALTQIESAAASQGLVIAGYYQAFENLRDVGIDRPPHRIAEKIAENYPNACIVTIDNRLVTLSMGQVAVTVSQCVDGKWKPREKGIVEHENDTLQALVLLLNLQTFDELSDFDNHLDCPSKDWMNPDVNLAVTHSLGRTAESEED